MSLFEFLLLLLVAFASFSNAEVIYLRPESLSGSTGQNYTFTCKARAERGVLPKLIWKKDHLTVPDESGKFIVQSTQNLTDKSTFSQLTILNASEKESGAYECQQKGLVASMTAKLDVFINFEYDVFPNKHLGPTGENYTFTCIAKIDSGPIPSLTWERKSQAISNASGMFVVKYTQNITENSAESVLTIVNAREDDNGFYACVHDVKGITGTFAGMLDLYREYAPIIEGDKLLKKGANLSYTCNVEGGTHPIQWRKDNMALPDSGRVDLDSDGKDDVEIMENNTLVILEASKEDAGAYTCIYNDGDKSFQNYIKVKDTDHAEGTGYVIGPSVAVSLLSLLLSALA